MDETRAKCGEFAHKWTVWEQGGHIISNGTIPGTKCICGQKILIEKFCNECHNRTVIAVNTDGKAADEWLGGYEEPG